MARKLSSGAKTKRNRQAVAKIGPKTVQRGTQNLCIHVKWGGNLGDFQGVVTLGVARDPKCIFPYRGEGFLEGSGRKTRLCYPKKGLCYPKEGLCYPKKGLCYRKTRLCYRKKQLRYPKKQLCYRRTRLCYRQTRLCYRETRTAVGGKHDYVTDKHGRQWAKNTIMLPRNTDRSGQKTLLCYRETRTAVGRKHDYVTEKHGPQRVEIPSRRAGETRSGRGSPRGGARKPDAGSRAG